MNSLMHIGLFHFITVSTVIFALGLVTVMTRRNAVAVLMGVELILNAASLNFVAFSRLTHGGIAGQVFSIFIILLAAAEACIALAIVLFIFRQYKNVDIDMTTALRE